MLIWNGKIEGLWNGHENKSMYLIVIFLFIFFHIFNTMDYTWPTQKGGVPTQSSNNSFTTNKKTCKFEIISCIFILLLI